MIFRFGFVLILLLSVSCKEAVPGLNTIIDSNNYLNDYTTFTSDSLVNIVIEIPAGTDQKWEVNKSTGFIEWERIGKDSLRVIKFLPYPANYGFIPLTLLQKEQGGDGDPLDVFLLGPATERGDVIPSNIVGVIKMIDNGEQDDKLIAVSSVNQFGTIKSLEQLVKAYPGIIENLTSWLTNYKGEGTITVLSVENEISALSILQNAMIGFQNEK